MHFQLEGARTFTYKVVRDTKIEIDIFEPNLKTASAFGEDSGEGKDQDIRVLLFIHGGAWIGGSRLEYSQLLLSEFLQRGYHIASADYRLLPESKFVDEQLEDIRDIEPWLRYNLPGILGSKRAISEILVAGASAGAHLALLTPKLWKENPVAILSLYGPTDIHSISYLNKGLISTLDIHKPDFKVLRTILNFETPPTQTPRISTLEESLTPRTMLGMYMFRSSTTAALLLRGLCPSKVSNSETPELKYPSSDDVSPSEVDAISPLYLASQIKYPPTYQILGVEDDLFDTLHVTRFAQALDSQNTAHAEVLVPGAGHAFDMFAPVDGQVHLEILRPAVEWLVDQHRVTR